MNKTEQLIDAIDHPEKYSDEELQALLSNPEVREAYDVMCNMRATFSPTPEADIDKEWQIFSKRELPMQAPKRFFRKRSDFIKKLLQNSAAVVAVCLLSAAAIATVVGVRLHERRSNPISTSNDTIELSQAATIKGEEDTSAIEDTATTRSEPVLFENRPLEEILNTMKEHYQLEVVFESQKAKNLRLYFNWDPQLPIADIVALLNNFQQFSIKLSANTLIVE
ncbi:MAG: DUF4974 domain-containing protein [Muribaculaceae bacterium]|nr:DUF4974 domain-containing protein [Muribaculaceae bacterium]